MTVYDLSQMVWTRDKCFLFSYYPKNSSFKNQYTELLLQFKKKDTAALQIVTSLALQALALYEKDVRDYCKVWYLVTIPSHNKGVPNGACEILCARLALQYSWLVHLPYALKRVEGVTKSATAKYKGEKRAAYWDHVETISYEGTEPISQESGFFLVDDVFTTGNTFNACHDIIKDATCCMKIIGFFVGMSVK